MEKHKHSNKITISRFWYIFMIVVIVVLAILIIVFCLRTYRGYLTFKSHESYFKHQNIGIEPWMNVHVIEKRFNITQVDLSKELNINVSKISQTSTLDSLCKKNNLNCTEVVNELNNLVK